MHFLSSAVIFAVTISALPVTSESSTPASADGLANNAIPANIAIPASVNDGPNWGPPGGGYGYGPPPGYSYGPGPGNGGGRGGRGPPSTGGALESIGYGLGSAIGTPVGWLGDLVGGAGSGLYNGLRGGYRMIKG